MKALRGRFELDEPLGRVNFEHPATIMAIVCDVVFFGKQEEGEDVSNAVIVDIDFVRAKIRDIVGRHDTLVAVDLDGMGSGMDIVDVGGIGEEVDGALTVEEEEAGGDC